MKKNVYRKQALLFKAFAHPIRLMIIDRLLREEMCVGEVEVQLELKQANVSQHLHILRNAGIVDFRKEGKKRCYFIVSPDSAQKLFRCSKRRLK